MVAQTIDCSRLIVSKRKNLCFHLNEFTRFVGLINRACTALGQWIRNVAEILIAIAR